MKIHVEIESPRIILPASLRYAQTYEYITHTIFLLLNCTIFIYIILCCSSLDHICVDLGHFLMKNSFEEREEGVLNAYVMQVRANNCGWARVSACV